MPRLMLCSLSSLVALAGCGDSFRPGDAAPDAPSSDAGDDSDVVGLAVLSSDYTSTSISLVDPATGKVTKDNCIHSGTQTPQNSLALSGDVGLPSQPQPMNLLVAIDRANSALTWIDPTTCKPLRQLDVSTGFYSNPYDVIAVSPTKAYVTRYERNAAPTPDPADHDEGDDLLIIDPSVPAITGRIALSSYAVTVPNATILARPAGALLIEDKLYVMLASLSSDFLAAGHGRLAVVDTATDQVTDTIDIPDFKNCGSMSYVESTKTLVVGCGGSFADPDQAATSGIAYIDLGAAPPRMTRKHAATPFGGRAVAGYAGDARDGALGFGVTFGEFGGDPKDQFWAFDVMAGTATKLADASDSFTFGDVLVDAQRQRVYLTDGNASTPRVHVYSFASDPTLDTSINASAATGLPPRELAWY